MSNRSSAYIYEIGGDVKGIVGDVIGGVVNQYIIAQKSETEIHSRTLIKGSPYMGLNKFKPRDKDKFFGREQWIIKLSNHLEENNLLFLLGASGSGKSSLVQAGLIPHLSDQWGAARVVTLIFVPDKNPFESLYDSLPRKYKEEAAEIIEEKEPKTLVKLVNNLKEDSHQWLVFIDQFEELFTITPKLERDKFIASLVQLIKQQDNSVKLLMAMRSDFLDNLRDYADITNEVESKIRLVRELTEIELRLAIAEPAARNGVTFEKGLVEQIVSDFYQQAGSLPLLQYTLDLLWSEDKPSENNRVLNIATYQAIGGVSGALQQQADHIYNEKLNNEEKKAAEKIFIELIDIAAKEPVSRRIEPSQFRNDPVIKSTLNKLIEYRLLVSGRYQSTVEVAHEELLRCWGFIQNLMREQEEIIILRSRLIGDANQWYELRKEDEEKAQDELWSGSKLERVLELIDEKAFGSLDEESEQFIQASVEKRDRQKREKEEQRRRELEAAKKLAKESEAKRKIAEKARKAAQRTRNRAIAAGLVMAGLAVFAGLQWRNAQIAQIRALINSSDARFAAGQEFDALLDSLRATKKLQALFLGNHDSQLKADNAQVLQQAVYEVKEYNRLEGNDEPLGWGVDGQISWSSDGQTLAFASGDKNVKLWRQDGTKPKILGDYETEVLGVSWNPDGQILATISNDGTVKLWKLNGDLLKMFKVDERPYGINWSPDGELVAIPFFNATVQLWKPDGTLFKTLEGHSQAVFSVSWNPDGQILASGSADRTVRLWKRDGNLSQTSEDYRFWVTGVSWSPNGQILAFGTSDGTVRLRKPDETVINLKHERGIESVSWSPDGKTLATSSFDKTVKWWKQDGTLLTTFHFPTVIAGLKWSPDGKILATLSSGDGTVRLWKKNPLLITLNDQNNVNDASFSPDGKILATASENGTVKLWTRDGNLSKTLLKDYDGSVQGVSWSPDGQILASAHFKTVKLWTRNGTLIKTLTGGHGNRVFRVSWSPDGKLLASCDGYHNLNLWQRDGTLLNKVVQYSCADLSWSPDGNGNILAAVNGNIRSAENGHVLLRKQDGNLITKLDIENVGAVSWSSDGQTLATIGDNKIKLWNRDGRLLKPIETDGSALGKIALSPDGQTLATSSENTIKLWKLDGTLLTTLKGHTDVVNSVTWSPDGKSLATASSDKTVKLWRLDVNLDEEQFLKGLLIHSCDWMQDYLENNPNVEESDGHLCDGIGTQK